MEKKIENALNWSRFHDIKSHIMSQICPQICPALLEYALID